MSRVEKSHYPLEFKQSSAKLAYESDKPIAQTAKDLGISANTLYTWVNKFYPDNKCSGPDIDLKSALIELKKLRQENAQLQQEKEILKKAAAYFAKEV